MKKIVIWLVSLVTITGLTACGSPQQAIPQNKDIKPPEVVQPEVQADNTHNDFIEDDDYMGTWTRTGATVNGAPQQLAPSTVIITADQYTATTAQCVVQGDLIVTDNNLDIDITSNSCPANSSSNYVFTYKVSDDGETLTLTNTQFGGTMIETYKLVPEEDSDDN